MECGLEAYMTKFAKKRIPTAALLIAIVFLPVFLGTCGGTIGFGDIIDFEPPIIQLGRGSNPRYVSDAIPLRGYCWDNIGVEYIVCRILSPAGEDAGRILGETWPTGNEWEMHLNLDRENDNGKSFEIEIAAYDRAKNCGEQSKIIMNIIVDIHAPIFNSPEILRSSRRVWPAEPMDDLLTMVDEDPNGYISGNVERYQNGAFWIRAAVSDDISSIKENKIEESTLILSLFYVEDPSLENYTESSEPIYSEPRDGGTLFFPEWNIAAGKLLKDHAGLLKDYNDNKHLFFRIRLQAEDLAGNVRVDDEFGPDGQKKPLFFCLFKGGDVPKARMSIYMQFVDPGTIIPLDIFDDDQLAKVYVGLMTELQFYSHGADGDNRRQVLEKIKDKLESGDTVYNWEMEKHGVPVKIENLITNPNGNDEQLSESIMAGQTDSDCDNYILFTIVQDKKSPPHVTGDADTFPDPVWGYDNFTIIVTDKNSPIVVIDTVNTSDPDYIVDEHLGRDDITWASTGDSPEENTFPALEDGKYFTIQGYTLRLSDEAGKKYEGLEYDDDAVKMQKVAKFKIAWIPYYIPGGQDASLEQVREAMACCDDPDATHIGHVKYPVGVQFWDLDEYVSHDGMTPPTDKSYFTDGTPQKIDDAWYAKQTFKKRFNLLGDAADDLKPAYRNFVYNSTLENEPKLFVLYARDSFNHNVYKTIRLLGKKDPPAVRMYIMTQLPKNPVAPNGQYYSLETDFKTHPNYSWAIPPGDFDPENKTHQRVFSENISVIYEGMTNPATHPNLARSFETYPRNSTLWVYVKAEEAKGVRLKPNGIKMYDTTRADASILTERGWIGTDQDITYAEALSDLEQRVFQIEAENMLGIKTTVQRTVAVTNTAMLEDIITTLPSGEYGATEIVENSEGAQVSQRRKIPLRAHFTAMVQVVPSRLNRVPHLNIRYETDPDEWTYLSIPLSQVKNPDGSFAPDMYLPFDFEVPDGSPGGPPAANGRLQTLDLAIAPEVPSSAKGPHVCGVAGCTGGLLNYDRPISLPFEGGDAADVNNYARILDFERNDPALIVDNAKIIWDAYKNGSLQKFKNITLDGLNAILSSVIVSGKASYKDDGDKFFYFRATGFEPVGSVPGEKYGETIMFEIKSNKDIRAQDNPRIRFRIQQYNSDGSPGAYYPSNASPMDFYADYLRPAGKNGLVFFREVNPKDPTTEEPKLPDGRIVNLALDYGEGFIVDRVANQLDGARLNGLFMDTFTTPVGSQRPYFVYVKTDVLSIPSATLTRPSDWPAPLPFPPLSSPPPGGGDTYMYATNPVLNISFNPGNPDPKHPLYSFGEYSLDGGLTWTKIGETAPGTTLNGSILTINNGPWTLAVRQRDKAGNVSDRSATYKLDIDANFPKMVAITLVDPDGIYKIDQSLTFQLDFERPVITTHSSPIDANRAYIIVSDIGTSPSHHGSTDSTDPDTWILRAEPNTITQRSSTLSFKWDPIGNYVNGPINDRKKMENGLTITRIVLNGGVEDLYGNKGTNSDSATKTYISVPAIPPAKPTITPGYVKMFEKGTSGTTYDVENLHGYGVTVYAIPPTLLTDECDPSDMAKYTAGTVPKFIMTDNHSIKLVFDSYMQKGVGTVTIKPSGTYPIPPVFPAEAHEITEHVVQASGPVKRNKVWVESFLDVYSRVPAAQRTDLLRGTYENPTLYGVSGVTALTGTNDENVLGKGGLYVGPYRFNTQGLVPGPGYDANPDRSDGTTDYNGTESNPGWNRVWAATHATEAQLENDDHFMVPDVSSKFVLHYEYNINSNSGGVANIRTALEAARFRWREIDVTLDGDSNSEYDNISVNPANKKEVIINLHYALPQGMRWEISWTRGSFEDLAGNSMSATATNGFVFWSDGVQAPVIRVQRRTVDYKGATPNGPYYPGNFTYADAPGSPYDLASLDSIAYKIESETPEISGMTSGTLLGKQGDTDVNGELSYAAVTFANTGGVSGSNPATSWATAATAGGVTYATIKANKTGTWVLPNLLHRGLTRVTAGDWSTRGLVYFAEDEYGTSKTVNGSGYFSGMRSYNRDATRGDLNGVNLSSRTVNNGNNYSFDSSISALAQTASKNYIIATASKVHGSGSGGTVTKSSPRAYEGAYMTVVALSNMTNTGNPTYLNTGWSPIVIYASDNEGPPSVAGFPMVNQVFDARYFKGLYQNGRNLYWRSTEIVTSWYLRFNGEQNGSGYTARSFNLFGDVGASLSGSYGDLTYSYDQDVQ